MSRVKIGQFKFGEDTFTLRYVLERDQSIKFVARDVAASLKMSIANKRCELTSTTSTNLHLSRGVCHTPLLQTARPSKATRCAN
uniref:BRO-B n=1 Tax=Lymantria dispar multicapsid nuclear polyhedrosis virus TaxID=10449 RepID=V9TJR0_NPVLD|nr:BRO-B [Lymantria dispar multiple nucleopolyhedrovirus]